MSIPKKIFIFTSVLSTIIALLVPLHTLFAQNPPQRSFDLTVSPVFFDLSAKPGDTLSDQMRIRNNTNEEIPLKVEIRKFGGDTQGDVTIKNTKDDTTLSWIEIKNKTLKARPKEWTIIPFTITIPKNAAFGYYWAVSFTQDTPIEAAKTPGAAISGSLVVPILLNVKNEGAKTEGKFVSFKTDVSFYEYLPVKFIAALANTGNVHIKPRGNIFIKDWTGKSVATLEVNSSQGAILPGTKRSFESLWNDSFAYYQDAVTDDNKPVFDKNGKQKRDLKFRFDKILDLRIGKYTATSLFVISTEVRDVVFEQTTSFIVFPWKIVLGVFVFTIFALLGIVTTTRTFGKKIIKLFNKFRKKG